MSPFDRRTIFGYYCYRESKNILEGKKTELLRNLKKEASKKTVVNFKDAPPYSAACACSWWADNPAPAPAYAPPPPGCPPPEGTPGLSLPGTGGAALPGWKRDR